VRANSAHASDASGFASLTEATEQATEEGPPRQATWTNKAFEHLLVIKQDPIRSVGYLRIHRDLAGEHTSLCIYIYV